jgi:chromate transporter
MEKSQNGSTNGVKELTQSPADQAISKPQPPSSSTDIEQQQQLDDDKNNLDLVVEATWRELIKQWFILGCTAFGGPAAHIAIFQRLFVDKLHWLTMHVFTELLMLGQCMPGPTSTQFGFALGVLKKGLSGGLVSGVLFQGPGFLILAILGWVASKVLDDPPDWLTGIVAGLAAAGIALVASAAKSLLRNICKGRVLEVIATTSGVVAYYYPRQWTFPSLIILGGLATLIINRNVIYNVAGSTDGVDRLGLNKLGGAILLTVWVVVLVTTIVLAADIPYKDAKELHWFASFYRTGSVIFGGGQVVLPMLFNEVVDQTCTSVVTNNGTSTEETCTESSNSWMTADQFYAGLALAQAMPGPLFNFAAYLGAVIAQNAGSVAVVGVIICWVALFAPGIIIIFAILPYWGTFRNWQIYRRALPGLNSSAVGLIVASVFQLTLSAYDQSPFPHTSICIGIVAYAVTEVFNCPAPLVVVGGGVLGVLGWGADMN